MGVMGLDIRNKLVTASKRAIKGLYAIYDGAQALAVGQQRDACDFLYVTGADGFVDIPAVAGTYVIMPPTDVPDGLAIDITNLALYVTGTTAWTGGTAGTKSLILQDTGGTEIAAFTQAALTGSTSNAAPTTYSISAGSTLASGVTDNAIRVIGASAAKGLGLRVVVANTPSAGSPVRLRISGHFILP